MGRSELHLGHGGPLRTRLPEPIKKVARRVRRLRRSDGPTEAHPPVLSVVVPAYQVEAYLGECLDSLLAQSCTDLEVIVIDDGSTDRTRDVALSYADRDRRIRVLTQPNSGQGIARNLGVAHAQGEFLTFVDADDTVPPRAFDLMIGTLRRTGSDFCVGAARRMAHQRFMPNVWTHTVHNRDRLGVTLSDFPLAMHDIIACNRLFRTAFWREKVGGFRGHIAYEDHVPMLTAYVRATRFDILEKITYNWRVREDLTSTSQQKASLENLLDRIAVKEEANDLLLGEAPREVYDMWVARAIDIDFPPFVESALGASEMYRSVLAAVYRTFLARATPETLAEVGVAQKTRAWLAAEERWDDLAQAQEHFTLMRKLPATRVEAGRIVAEPQDFLREVPESIRELNAVETRFDGAVERTVPQSDGRLEVAGWAFIRGLDMPEPGDLEAWLVEVESDDRIDLAIEARVEPQATIWARDRAARYDGAGFRIMVNTGELPLGRWQLHVQVRHRGISRSDAIHRVVAGGSAARPVTTVSLHSDGARAVTSIKDSEHGFLLEVEPSRAVLHDAAAEEDRVTGILETPASEKSVALFWDNEETDRALQLTELPVPSGAATRRWQVEGPVPQSGESRQLLADLGEDETARVLHAVAPSAQAHTSHWAWTRGSRAGAWLSPVPTPGEVIAIEEHPDTLVVDVSAADLTALEDVRLENQRTVVPAASVESLGDHIFRVRFPLRLSVLGHADLPLTSGELVLKAGDGAELHASVPLRMTLPIRSNLPELRLTITSPPRGAVLVTVAAPLRPTEVSLAGQYALQQDYQASSADLRESVLFQCYRGEFATDSQVALDRGLAAVRPELARIWGVADFSVPVPEGSIPVLIGSQEWYDALATSRYLCNNVDFDSFFRKRPGQRYLQTFHGYPFKSMGRGFWAGKGYGEERIAREIARRNDEYDAILVPSERAAGFYRSEYDYTGTILVTGYPRSDVLINADRAAVRNRVLNGLDVDPGQKVVLYAPTYRDNLTTRTFAAKRFDELDLEELTRSLGPGYTVLLRGHNNNQREDERTHDVAQVVDVTDYPEINDLTIAADAAILDYSSLRFDWALTGKPMVFFVPDQDTYFGQRPPLFDFTESAPGPLLTSTEEVGAALRDLDGLLAGQKEDIAAFNAEFNQLHDGHATDRVIEAFFSD